MKKRGYARLDIYIDTYNINDCDLVCKDYQLDIEVSNNQTLQVTAYVSNYSSTDIVGNIGVECQITNNVTNYCQTSTGIITGLSARETKDVTISFNISDCMPTEFNVLIKVDPNHLIPERNEENNEAETAYYYYKYQENYPVLINHHGALSERPLINVNDILLNGTKIQTSGSFCWERNNQPCMYSIPIMENERTDYIVNEYDDNSGNFVLTKINGDTGEDICSYQISGSYVFVHKYCLGDITGDGEDELILLYGSPCNNLIIFSLDGTCLFDNLSNVKDIAIGDRDNDGKNELFISRSNQLYCYDFINNNLICNGQTAISTQSNIILNDFNNDGILDCATFSNYNIYLIDCSTMSAYWNHNFPLIILNFSSGDIDNDGINEIIFTQSGTNNYDTSVYLIDYIESAYEMLLFSENEQFNI